MIFKGTHLETVKKHAKLKQNAVLRSKTTIERQDDHGRNEEKRSRSKLQLVRKNNA